MTDEELEEFRRALVTEEMDKAEKVLAGKPDLERPFPRTGGTPLYEVAMRLETTVALERLLAAGANPNGINPGSSESPLGAAARRGRVQVVAALVKAGADVNFIDRGGNSVLAQATGDGGRKHLQVVQMLLAAGANANPRTEISPLMQAAGESSVDILRAMLQSGADVNYQSARFGNALFRAVNAGRHDNVQFLLAAGADQTVLLSAEAGFWYGDKFVGKTALEMATALKKQKVIEAFAAASAGGQGQASASKPGAAPDVAETWKALEKWLKKHNPDMKKSLAKGAGDKAFAKLEKLIGQELPADFKASYGICDGQKETADDGLIPPTDELDAEYKLLSLKESAAEWQMLKEMRDDGEFTREGSPDAGVKAEWWNPGWLPFASDGGGDSLCIDLAPAQGGQRGQVISCAHDSARRQLLAGSFAAWLADLAERIMATED